MNQTGGLSIRTKPVLRQLDYGLQSCCGGLCISGNRRQGQGRLSILIDLDLPEADRAINGGPPAFQWRQIAGGQSFGYLP
jgi:hypothetical protein